jgi:hypothetical protein
VLREVTRGAADAILAGERPGDVRVADDYPTEFSAGVAQGVGAERQFGPFFLHRAEDDLVVGEIGGAFVDEEGTIEIGYAVVSSIPTSRRRPPLPLRTRIAPRRWSRSCSASASASWTRSPARQRTTIIARTRQP